MIQENDIVMLLGNQRQALFPAQAAVHLDLRELQKALRDKQIHLIVIHQQNLRRRRDEPAFILLILLDNSLHTLAEIPDGFQILHLLQQTDRERAAFPIGALHLNRATHHLYQFHRDGKSESGSLNIARPA